MIIKASVGPRSSGSRKPDSGSPDLTGAPSDKPGSVSTPNAPKKDRLAEENEFSPDFKSEPEHKPKRDADIDTDGG